MQSRTSSSWLAWLPSVLVCKHTYLSIFLYTIIVYTVHCWYRVRTRMMSTHAGIRVKFMMLIDAYMFCWAPSTHHPQWSWSLPFSCGVDGGKVMMVLTHVILCFLSTGNGAVWIPYNGGGGTYYTRAPVKTAVSTLYVHILFQALIFFSLPNLEIKSSYWMCPKPTITNPDCPFNWLQRSA